MRNIYLNAVLQKRVERICKKYTQKCKRRFLRRKTTHLNKENISDFYSEINHRGNEKLFEINYHSSFSYYLYLYLRDKAVPLELDKSKEFTISKPVKANLTQIAQKAKVSRNTVSVAFAELLHLGLFIYNEAIPFRSNKVREVMVLNDYYVIGYDEGRHKIVYSINISN